MSVERYRQTLRIVRQYDSALFSWLADGLVATESGGDLAAALKLPSRYATGQRNRLLAEAAEIIAPGRTSYKQAERLVKNVARVNVVADNSRLSRLIRDAAMYKSIPTSINGMAAAISTAKPTSKVQ